MTAPQTVVVLGDGLGMAEAIARSLGASGARVLRAPAPGKVLVAVVDGPLTVGNVERWATGPAAPRGLVVTVAVHDPDDRSHQQTAAALRSLTERLAAAHSTGGPRTNSVIAVLPRSPSTRERERVCAAAAERVLLC